ncbi:MAG: formylmethanofuran dehydrogenase subunit B [Methylophilaceae bacterium]|nr:formylmethanofuran dehydrogenase subunit B [Methylophilaceae bacterium]
MDDFAQASAVENVTCPFCGLLCDDLTVERDTAGALRVGKNGCSRSITFFERGTPPLLPRLGGEDASLQDAIAGAAEFLRRAHHPLIAGLGTEVQGMRAVTSLADKLGATIDHMHSKGFMRNLLVVQNSGWLTTTLTEVRNRVDLLVIIGTDVVSLLPRFFERVVWNRDSLFGQDTAQREIVYLGGQNIDTTAGIAPDGRKPEVLPCEPERLPEVAAALRALVAGKKLAATEIAGIATTALEKLAERLKTARYSVFTWSARAMDFPHAELTVQNITETIKILNQTTRSSGLPLGGNDGDVSINQVSAWISGYPVRTSYGSGHPEYDPYHFSTDRLIDRGEADVLVWISTFDPGRIPPATNLPTIVLGHPGMKFDQEPDIFIPVGVPGMDHRGVLFRMDGVVALPIDRLRSSTLPSLGEVLAAIEQAL